MKNKTQPIPELLPDINPHLKETLVRFSELLDEIVHFGTHLLIWDIQVQRKGKDNNIPTLFLRNILEMTDAISSLIKNSSIDTSKLLFRSTLESVLSLTYMIEKKEKLRSQCFMVYDTVEQINEHEKWISTSSTHSEFIKSMRNDEFDLGIERLFDRREIVEFISVKKLLLNNKEFKPVYDEYMRLKKSRRQFKWYSLFNEQITNFQKLCEYLKKGSLYHVYYKTYSRNIHGTEIMKGFVRAESDGHANLIQIRDFKDAQNIVLQTIQLIVELYSVFVKKRVPHKFEELQKWYREYKPEFNFLLSNKVINYKA